MTHDPAYPRYPTIVHALAKAAELNPAAPGLMCQERFLTYGDYARAVAALAFVFADLGVAHERIAFLMTNSAEAVVGMLAGMAARAQVSPLNPAYTERELEPLLRDVEPRVLVCDGASIERGRAFAQRLAIAHVIVLGPGGLTIDDLLARPPHALPLPDAEDLSALFFTGGTTGLPEGRQPHPRQPDGLLLRHRGAVAVAARPRSASSTSPRCFTSGASASRW